jgi:hypothetical protein
VGTTSLEFALILTAFLWLVPGTIDMARYFFTVQGVMSEAGRMSLMDSNWGPCGIDYWGDIASIAPLLDPTRVKLCVSRGYIGSGPTTMSVTVRYPFTPFTPGLSALTRTISESTSYTY